MNKITRQKINRRGFLRYGVPTLAITGGAVALGFRGLRRYLETSSDGFRVTPFGKIIPDPNGVIDLPVGFSYQAFSRTGEMMDDGLLVPGGHDGMAGFPGMTRDTVVLVRNHEIRAYKNGKPTKDIEKSGFGENNHLIRRINSDYLYDSGSGDQPAIGGTTNLVYNTKTNKLEKHFMSLAGTNNNCAGGPTPWNTWITCEEDTSASDGDFAADHGYNFEVPARSISGLTKATPLKAMGRFNHEAVAVDSRTGIVYQTEDRLDGLIYRFIPDQPSKLHKGGRLQALAIRDMPSASTCNWRVLDLNVFKAETWSWYNRLFKSRLEGIALGAMFDIRWIDIDEVESPKDDLRKQGLYKGAAVFARGEGMFFDGQTIFFVCTAGGPNRKGQVWRYIPSRYEGTTGEEKNPAKLELFVEPNQSRILDMGDNITMSPWGDLVICEDGSEDQHLIGITPNGELYRFARNAMPQKSELTGSTFSPDGTTLFVNIQSPGLTLAITGPWMSRSIVS